MFNKVIGWTIIVMSIWFTTYGFLRGKKMKWAGKQVKPGTLSIVITIALIVLLYAVYR